MDKKEIDVVGLGASTIDILTLVDHFPTRRETQQSLSTVIQGGGPIATAMVTVSRLGGKSLMIDNIADDWAGKLVQEGFRNEKVNIDHMEVHPGCTTSISNILVSAEDGARAILFQPGSVPEVTLSKPQKDAIQSAKIIHLNGRHWEACLEAAKLAKESGTQVSFDGGANRYRPELRELMPFTNICIVAKDFAEKYTGHENLRKSAEAFLGEGPEISIVTNGANGSWVCTKDGLSFHQSAFHFPKTIDTTGCGDSYHGAFLVGLLKGFTAEKSAILASAVAGMNSQHLGGRTGIPTFDEVINYLAVNGIRLE
jgi:sugar/nucleoside kinase (ribokinase family)